MIHLLLLAQLSFPPLPAKGDCFKSSTDARYCYDGYRWLFAPIVPTKVHARIFLGCPTGTHLHPSNMVNHEPDVIGGPVPIADGKCHIDDRSDRVPK